MSLALLILSLTCLSNIVDVSMSCPEQLMKHFVSQILDVSGSCPGQLKLFVSLVSFSRILDVSGSCSADSVLLLITCMSGCVNELDI